MKNIFSKKVIILFLIGCIAFSNKIYATLSPGDIAIIGYDAEPLGNKIYSSFTFTFRLLANIPAGEPTITFTDHGWVAGAFTNNNIADGYLKWTPTQAYPAGTVIKVKINSGGTFSSNHANFIGPSVVVNSGWTHPAISSSGGDQVLVYQGTEAAPTFIYGFTSEASQAQIPSPGTWQPAGGPNKATNSELPPGLIIGTTAVTHTNNANAPIANTRNASNGWSLDNLIYVGPIVATKATMLTNIGLLTNWNGQESIPCGNDIYSVATGNWTGTGTWVCGRTPTIDDAVIINNHVITINTNCFAKNITYASATGTIKLEAGGNLQLKNP